MRADHFETLFRLSVSCHRYAVRFLYFAYDDDAVQAAYAVNVSQGVEHEVDAVKRRIEEASKYVSLDRLYLSPQCGFASCEIGNKLTEEQQWAKIDLVREIAAEVWK